MLYYSPWPVEGDAVSVIVCKPSFPSKALFIFFCLSIMTDQLQILKNLKLIKVLLCFTVRLLLSPFHFKSCDTYDIDHTNKTLSLKWRGHRSYLSLISRGQ